MAHAIRYQPLRALPPHPYVPGRESGEAQGAATRPREAPAPPALYLPDKRWEQHDEYLWGVDLYNAGFFWEAHEAWEALWRAAQRDPVQHAFLQGLIQYAAACLKGAMGDAEAARRLAARAAARFDHVRTERGDQYMGLDVVQFAAAFRHFSDADPTALERRPQLSLLR